MERDDGLGLPFLLDVFTGSSVMDSLGEQRLLRLLSPIVGTIGHTNSKTRTYATAEAGQVAVLVAATCPVTPTEPWCKVRPLEQPQRLGVLLAVLMMAALFSLHPY